MKRKRLADVEEDENAKSDAQDGANKEKRNKEMNVTPSRGIYRYLLMLST